jgi:hypothetical protein
VTQSEPKVPRVALDFVTKIEPAPSPTDAKTFPGTRRDVPDAEKFDIEFTLRIEVFARVTNTLVAPIDVGPNRFPRTLSAFPAAVVPIPIFETKLVVRVPMLPVVP